VVVGYSTSSTSKSVALLLLQNLRAGAQFSMTDNAYTGSAFKTTEGVVTFTASAAVPRGTVLVWTTAAAGWTTSSAFAISTTGDNIVLFSGTLAAPSRFHYALTYNVVFDAPSSALTANQCALPASLVLSRTALELPRLKAGRYSGPTEGSREELLVSISDPSRWTQGDTVVLDPAALPAFIVRDGNSEPTAQPIKQPTTAPITPTTSSPTSSPTMLLVTSPPSPPSSAPPSVTSSPPSSPSSAPPSSGEPATASPTSVGDQAPIQEAATGGGGKSGSASVTMAAGIGVGAVLLAGLAVAFFALRNRASHAAGSNGTLDAWGGPGGAAALRSPQYMGDIGDDLVVQHRTADQFAARRQGDSPVGRSI
jgi:hypothetical protein